MFFAGDEFQARPGAPELNMQTRKLAQSLVATAAFPVVVLERRINLCETRD